MCEPKGGVHYGTPMDVDRSGEYSPLWFTPKSRGDAPAKGGTVDLLRLDEPGVMSKREPPG